MCGIAGIITNDNLNTTKMDELFNILKDGNKHRGPYFQGEKTVSKARFFHARIPTQSSAIIGQQPMLNNNTLITYNGDIYSDGRQKLEKIVGTQKDDSDTSLLLAGFNKLGAAVTNYLGSTNEFSFCFFDANDETVFVARDYSGNRPFFYVLEKDLFCFSSVSVPLIRAKQKNLLHGEIKELVPGYSISGTLPQLSVNRLPTIYSGLNTDLPFDNFVEQLYLLIEDAVRIRIPNKKFGVKNSGGLDSLSAFHLAKKILKEQGRDVNEVVPVTVGKKDSPDVLAVLKYYKQFNITNYIIADIDEKELFASVPKVIEIVESRHINQIRLATINMVMAEQFLKQNIHVVLSGEGVEEVFGSYPDVFLAGYDPRVEKFYPKIKGLTLKESFEEMWHLFFSQRALTERWRNDRIMTGMGINDRPYITDKRIEDTVERLYADGKIDQYCRFIQPGRPIIDKYVMRLAMFRHGKLPKEFAFRPKLQGVVGTGAGTHDPDTGLFSKIIKDMGCNSFQDYIDKIFIDLGLDIPALAKPREMTKIMGNDIN
ncbi:MAG: asparagine synthase-related protein [bacterium]|nr:asparagine synthase-related protein [bacterium]